RGSGRTPTTCRGAASCRRLPERPARLAQKHVIEARPVQLHGQQLQVGAIEQSKDGRHRLLAAVHIQMDGAVFETRLSDEGFALDQVESAPLLAGDAEGDHVARDRTLQLLRRTFGDDLAVVDDRDAVAKSVRLVEVVGREEYGRAAI